MQIYLLNIANIIIYYSVLFLTFLHNAALVAILNSTRICRDVFHCSFNSFMSEYSTYLDDIHSQVFVNHLQSISKHR